MMMKSIISGLFFFFISICAPANDSTKLVYDTTQIDVRNFDQEAIEDHKADDDFDYGIKPNPELTLWERFKRWLQQIINDLFYMGTSTPFGKVVIYIIIGAVVVYAIYKLLKIKSSKLFYSERNNSLNYELYHEDIHEMDFEKLISEAIAAKNYRLAIRLIYLHALKHLDDKNLIVFQPGKTNHDYIEELENEQYKSNFGDLSYYFDYAWYGDFKVDEGLFEKVKVTYEHFEKELNL